MVGWESASALPRPTNESTSQPADHDVADTQRRSDGGSAAATATLPFSRTEPVNRKRYNREGCHFSELTSTSSSNNSSSRSRV